MSGEEGFLDGGLWLACHILYAGGISRFLGTHLQGSRRREGIFGLLILGGSLILRMWAAGGNVPYITHAACSHILLGILTAAMFGGEMEKRVLAAVLGMVMTELLWNFGDSFFSFGALVLIGCVKGKGEAAAVIGPWMGRVCTVMTYGAGIWAVGRLSKALKPVFEGKRGSLYLWLSAPLGCLLFVTDLVNWGASNGILVQNWMKFGLYENQLFSHGAMCVFTGLSMAAAGFFVFGTDRIVREEQEREQYRAQAAYYEMMEEQYGSMERLRHDMKNHMLALENLVQNRQWQQAVEYLREMGQMGAVGAGDEATGSLVMDALLYHKRQQALKRDIRWQCDVRVPKNCPVKEVDLCIIAGNILDNALEACAKLKAQDGPFIHVYMGTVKSCLFMEVQNSMEMGEGGGPGQDSGKAGRRGKGDFRRHGLGLGNIRAAAAGYNGAVRVEAENGIFTISVLLPMYRT